MAVAAAAFAQAPQTVIHTETRLVLVDTVVRDKKGKAAEDLGAAEFRIWEDGKEQPIESFSREPSEREYLLFLFDNSAPAAKSARQDVADFAGAYASPERLMAVMNFSGELTIAQNFTAAAERVQRAAADLSQIAVRSNGPRVTAMVARPDQGSMGDASSHFPGGYNNTGLITPEMGAMVRNAQMAQQPQAALVLQAIRDAANSMAAIRGRKSIVVVGGADTMIYYGPTAATEAAARDCNKANVAVYSTNVALRSLAEETGGRWLPDNLVHELSGLVDDQEKRYVLGFKPVESPDGSCHSLRVRTVRTGLQVSARDAYCNVNAPDVLAGKVEGKALEARAAGDSAGNAAASIELPYFYSSPGIALVDLAMEMDLANLKFTKENGKQRAELNLVGLAYGTDGGVAARFSDAVPLDFDTAQQAEALRKQPYRYERQFRLPAGRYNVRVAFGSGDQNFGKVEAPLTVDAWDGRRLALSGIALASDSQKVADLTSDLDPSLLEGHKDLIAKSTEISLSGGNRFQANAPCYAYLEIYNATPTVAVNMRVLDRTTGAQKAGGPVPAAEFIRAGNAVAPVLFEVPIASLPPGAYELEVTAARSPGDESAFRGVEFQIAEEGAKAAASDAGEALAKLEGVLPAPVPPAVSSTTDSMPSSEPEQENLLSAARQVAIEYASWLPNFLCTQTIRRSVDRGHGTAQVDTLTVEVGYYARQEKYRLAEVNGVPSEMFTEMSMDWFLWVSLAATCGPYSTRFRPLSSISSDGPPCAAAVPPSIPSA